MSISSQDERSRDMNTNSNRQKLVQEIERIYMNTVPNETSGETKDKYKKLYVFGLSGLEIIEWRFM
jgi:hypothetical protein